MCLHRQKQGADTWSAEGGKLGQRVTGITLRYGRQTKRSRAAYRPRVSQLVQAAYASLQRIFFKLFIRLERRMVGNCLFGSPVAL
jgi:hypothetical protein